MTDEEERNHLIDATTDERAVLCYGPGWRCIDTMPDKGHIKGLTVTGLIRIVDASKTRTKIYPSDPKGPRRLGISNLQLVAWRHWHEATE